MVLAPVELHMSIVTNLMIEAFGVILSIQAIRFPRFTESLERVGGCLLIAGFILLGAHLPSAA